MRKTGVLCPPGCMWSPWVPLPGTGTFSSGNQSTKLTVSIDPIGDGCTLTGEISYYAPGGIKKVDTFMDSITITRDGSSLDEPKVRVKNLSPLGTGVNIMY